MQEQFLILFFSSQPAEELFRELRSMTTTNHTQVDFTMKEFGKKLRRAQMKLRIAYRNKDILKFPTISRMESNYKHIYQLPSNREILETIEEALECASGMLQKLGISKTELSFEDSLIERQSSFEFVCTGDDVSDISEEFSSEMLPLNEMNEAVFEEESASNRIYDANLLFANFNGELHLKSSATRKNTFKIRDCNGNILFIKKSTLVWMLTNGRYRRTATRVARYRQPNASREFPEPTMHFNVDEALTDTEPTDTIE